MADSLRQRLVEKVETRMATITVANGYRTNAGSNVDVWRVASWDQDELPCINIRDLVDRVDESRAGTQRLHRLLGFELEVMVKESGEAAAETTRHVVADIQEAIGTDEKWDSLAMLTTYESDELDSDQRERKMAGAMVRFTIHYHQGRWDPDTVR